MVTLTHYSPDLFDAIAIEKSGIKGMRLLIDRTLVTKDVCDAYRIQTDGFGFTPFKRLRDSYYPNRIAATHMDFLWMATDRPEVRSEMEITMAKRLRLASFDAEEFAQAAATQVVFHQCSAMIASIAKYRFDRDSRKARQQRLASESIAVLAEHPPKNEPALDINCNVAEP
jgi:hypothetical protein